MKIVNRNNEWFPSILEGIFAENRLDVPNYENFSIPSVNIKEKNTNFVVELAAPGFKKEDFKIEVEENILKVSSKVDDKIESDGSSSNEDIKIRRQEFKYNSFSRTFNLPETIEIENIIANYEAGILTISLPKREEQKALKKMVEIS